MQNGKIGVTTENIFPIIKKFLYSDHEIFLRELVSNAVDATQKLKTLASIGDYKGELGDLTIHVNADPDSRTLTISDSGIGMSAEEVDKYINQIAFSGAEEFMEKYKNQNIIGHFGLGFYSAFMVAERVEVITQSHDLEKPTMVWSCDGTPEFTLTERAEKRARGTDIILHISEDSVEFADPTRIKGMLRKYCRFLPVPIACGKVQEWKDGKYVDTEKDEVINDTDPLWAHNPSEVTDEQYKEFYRQLYPGGEDPLFWIHLNIDYPFNLTGILYFPKIRNNFEIQKNKIQLYSNQVYVTDSVEGIVPEFLTLLHGVIDSPDIPLNVSRSYLQSDSNVKKISSYITRKVAERLQEIFADNRSEFESKWDDLKVFIEYGVVTEQKFAEKAENFVLVKNVDGKYFTLSEYKELVTPSQTDKNNNLIYLYANDANAQHSFIQGARDKGYDVLVMDGQLDNHFISWVESKNTNLRFVRVDSDIVEKLIEKDTEQKMSISSEQQETLRPLFEAQLPVDDKISYMVTFEAMAATAPPVMITQNEFMRRMKDMSAMGGGMASFYGQMPDNFNVVINGNHPLVMEALGEAETVLGEGLKKMNKKIDSVNYELNTVREKLKDEKAEQAVTDKEVLEELEKKHSQLVEDKNKRVKKVGAESKLVKQLIDLALLSNGMLKGENLTNFIRRSVELIGK